MVFQFKQFSIQQDLVAMKVGTDGVLLGAWFNLERAKKVLDIGTGTGLISLIGAQRNSKATFDAIDLDDLAYQQAKQNFKESPWSDRLQVFHTSIQDFNGDKKYTHIVSNPPFFEEGSFSKDRQRTRARNTVSLPFEILIQKVSVLLSNEGLFSVVLPYQSLDGFIALSQVYGLYLQRCLKVKGVSHKAYKRVLLEFGFSDVEVSYDELIIEEERHQYTQKYIDLTKEFYIKM